jgi:hypothetical protein
MPAKSVKIIKSKTDDIPKHPSVKPQELTVLLSESWFALCLGVWLCLLPVFLCIRPLPSLLQRFPLVHRGPKNRTPLEMDRAVRIVVRLCQLRLFRLPIFPKACLRQALALYHVLNRMGYPVEIHFGIHKNKGDLQGHSWVTIHGNPVADTARSEMFKPVYSHSSPRSLLPYPTRRRHRIKASLTKRKKEGT